MCRFSIYSAIMSVIFYLRQRRRYMFFPACPSSSVCLSACVQDYSKTCAWIWMKCYMSTDVGTWTNWSTFEPNPDDSPDPGTRFTPDYSISARLLKNACMDLDEMLHVDRYRDMDELINFWARIGLLSPISYALQRGILLSRENSTYR